MSTKRYLVLRVRAGVGNKILNLFSEKCEVWCTYLEDFSLIFESFSFILVLTQDHAEDSYLDLTNTLLNKLQRLQNMC